MRLIVCLFILLQPCSYASILWAPLASGHWSWVDHFQKPGESSQQEARVLGLTKLELDLNLERRHQWLVHMKVHPDAYLREEAWDSRAGLVYRKLPRPQLLNSYHLQYALGSQSHVSYGVWESLLEYGWNPSGLYDSGLQVWLPRFFSGGRILWSGIIESYGRWQFRIHSLSGRNDRGETLEKSLSRADVAPKMADPYWGAAFALDFVSDQNWRMSALLGMNPYHVDSLDGDDSVSSFVEEQFFYLGIKTPQLHSLQSVLDMRFSLEDFQEDSSQVMQKSVRMGLVWGLSSYYRLHASGVWGRSERWKAEDVSGTQMNLGFCVQLADGLEMDHVVSQENRSRDENGQRQLIRRMGVQIRWNLDSSSYVPSLSSF